MQHLPELKALEQLIRAHPDRLRVSVPAIVGPGEGYPVYALELGRATDDCPAIGFFGGVHGNERIGSQVVLAWLRTLLEQLRWDEALQGLIERSRLLFMPLLNPAGMAMNRRANGQGIDLMRNAPIESASAHWLLGGQRLSRHLPWYRGKAGELAPENRALVETVRKRLLNAPVSAALDCHSGFGFENRIWFPFAHSREPIPHLAEVFALRKLFRRSYPNHVTYRIEPQCQHYMTHGDIWDFLYLESLEHPQRTFLPLTLEMGSWLWVRKNPRQMFARTGLFNPLQPHRLRRILRQHLTWCDFLTRAIASHRLWLPALQDRHHMEEKARIYWRGHYAPEANDGPGAPFP